MRIVKHILTYLLWTIVSLLMGFGYMRLLLGNLPTDESMGGVGFMLKIFYFHGLTLLGFSMGGIITLLFILIDILYLSKKLKNNSKKSIIRIVVLLATTAVVALIHYVLEKVIDVI
ncbi:hypothetical protein [Algoriphagus litoralis]|uniref:hypothetical protein n=1 Tax=Algoriphagus litoralis TaxID=2202829 RepID=UPI001300BA20|nr:hypothetical protein [Algoriphagus litoralis]